jgi:hypothetical protein
MHNFLAPPAFKCYRLDGADPDIMDPGAPGASKFISDLIEDMLSLLPDLPGVYVDTAAGAPPEVGYVECFQKMLLQQLSGLTTPLPVVFGPCCKDISSGLSNCTTLSHEPHLLPRGMCAELPPTVEAYFELMPEPVCDKSQTSDSELERSRRLREVFSHIAQETGKCWKIIRDASENSMLPPSLGFAPLRTLADLRRSIDKLNTILRSLSGLHDKAAGLLEPLTAPDVLEGWWFSKIDPIREQVLRLEARALQVKTWIETV